MAKEYGGKTVNTEIEFAGIKFKSPIGVPAVGIPMGLEVTPEMHVEVILKHAEAGASFITTPGFMYSADETVAKLQTMAVPEEYPVYHRSQLRFLRADKTDAPFETEGAYSMATPFMLTHEHNKLGYAYSQELIKLLVEKKPKDVRLIANVAGLGDFPETYVEAAKMVEQFGVDLIELQASCPGPLATKGTVDYFLSKKYPLRMVGIAVGDHPDLVAKITREVVKAVNIPVGWKLTGETGFPRVVDMVRGIRDAGGTWVSTLNVSFAIMPPDIYNRGKPLWPFCDDNPFVGASGSWLRKDCYKFAAGIAKFVAGIDIMATGGISAPEHCVEAMMLGAKMVGLCTGLIYQGRSLIRRANAFIHSFMQEQGYERIEDFVGLGQEYIKPCEEVVPIIGKVVAELDPAKCTGCGICLDNLCVCFYSEGGFIKINQENCSGCGGCLLMCPADAIKLVLRE